MARQRYRNYWYGIVRDMIRRYPSLKNEHTIQSNIFVGAIENAIADTKSRQDGKEIIKAITLIYFDETTTIDGAALKLNVSRRTVQSWISTFVELTAKYAGFKK